MVGVIVVAHFGLAEKLVEVAEKIVRKKSENIIAITINPSNDINEINQKITKAIKKVDGKEGVLILTDMFGGTPCNMSLAFLKEGEIEVLTGLNLPMLIEVLDAKHEGKTLAELAQHIQSLGQKNICLASEILHKK
ncbi:MAG: PTS fructose transporter subunit IIA [Deltaproteobacteria bacterium]|nr:MAG: PTS fructose transporter subunit IIA [Deltaproteobacteria bacterium]